MDYSEHVVFSGGWTDERINEYLDMMEANTMSDIAYLIATDNWITVSDDTEKAMEFDTDYNSASEQDWEELQSAREYDNYVSMVKGI